MKELSFNLYCPFMFVRFILGADECENCGRGVARPGVDFQLAGLCPASQHEAPCHCGNDERLQRHSIQ